MNWQNLVIMGVIVAAGTYLTIHYVRKRRTKRGCDACMAGRSPRSDSETSTRSRSDGR